MIFDVIYAENLWNGYESRSGPGSGDAPTRRLAETLPLIVQATGAQSVLDVGCGDGYWMPELPGYVGVDVSAVAIARARDLHPDRHYEVGGIADRTADLVIMRDVMQHLPLEECQALLTATAGSRWLLASTYLGGVNMEVDRGAFYPPDLTAPPFDWPMPHLLIFDGWDYEHGWLVRDSSKFLGLWPLPTD